MSTMMELFRRRAVAAAAVAVVGILALSLASLMTAEGRSLLGLTAGASFPLTSDPIPLMVQEFDGTNNRKVLNLLARGADGKVWLLRRRQGVWDDWRSTGITGPAEGVGAAQGFATSWIYMFVRNGAQLTDWTYQSFDLQKLQQGGADSVRGSRAVALKYSVASHWMDVFARGENNSIWLRRRDGGAGWEGWKNLGGDKRDAPAAAEFAGSPQPRTAVFARGSDNALWYLRSGTGYYFEQGWMDWTKLGGTLASGPGVANTGDGLLHVFVRGSNNHLMHTWGRPDTNQWYGWQDLGGNVASAPGVTSSAPGHIEVFVTGSDQQLWGLRWNGSNWSPWHRVGEDPTLPVLTVTPPNHGQDDIYTQDLPGEARINCGLSANAHLPAYACAVGLERGASVTLHMANFDNRFKAWAGDCAHAGSNLTCTVVLNGNKTVSVTYK